LALPAKLNSLISRPRFLKKPCATPTSTGVKSKTPANALPTRRTESALAGPPAAPKPRMPPQPAVKRFCETCTDPFVTAMIRSRRHNGRPPNRHKILHCACAFIFRSWLTGFPLRTEREAPVLRPRLRGGRCEHVHVFVREHVLEILLRFILAQDAAEDHQLLCVRES